MAVQSSRQRNGKLKDIKPQKKWNSLWSGSLSIILTLWSSFSLFLFLRSGISRFSVGHVKWLMRVFKKLESRCDSLMDDGDNFHFTKLRKTHEKAFDDALSLVNDEYRYHWENAFATSMQTTPLRPIKTLNFSNELISCFSTSGKTLLAGDVLFSFSILNLHNFLSTSASKPIAREVATFNGRSSNRTCFLLTQRAAMLMNQSNG